MKTTTRLLGVLITVAITIPATAQERVGVATTVVGPVTVARVAASPTPLKFKDDVFINDRVTTGEQGFARMLLGGKAIVTARERSVITITEVPGVSTIEVVSGRISVAVDKSRMRPGEVVEIKTPNAVSGIRGTIVVAEVSAGVSTITVLRGLVDVYRRDPVSGNAVGQPTPVSARERVTVKADVLPARPQPISVDHARRLSSDFTAPVQPVSPADTIVADEVARATTLLGTMTGAAATTETGRGPMNSDAATTNGDKAAGGRTGERSAAPTAAAPALAPLPSLTVGGQATNVQPTSNGAAPTVSAPLPTTPMLSAPLPTTSLPTTPIAATPMPTTPAVNAPAPVATPPTSILAPLLAPVNSLLKK